MRTIFDTAMGSGKAQGLAVDLAVMLALTLLGVTTAALNSPVEPVTQATSPATGHSPNGQASIDASQQEPVGTVFHRTELYFGSEKPDGSEVTAQEFEQFVDSEVTPSFPDGLTYLTGDGQFRSSSGDIIEERSYVLILLYPLNDRNANSEIEEIREHYKREFAQESVLRVDSNERVSF